MTQTQSSLCDLGRVSGDIHVIHSEAALLWLDGCSLHFLIAWCPMCICVNTVYLFISQNYICLECSMSASGPPTWHSGSLHSRWEYVVLGPSEMLEYDPEVWRFIRRQPAQWCIKGRILQHWKVIVSVFSLPLPLGGSPTKREVDCWLYIYRCLCSDTFISRWLPSPSAHPLCHLVSAVVSAAEVTDDVNSNRIALRFVKHSSHCVSHDVAVDGGCVYRIPERPRQAIHLQGNTDGETSFIFHCNDRNGNSGNTTLQMK